MDTTLEYRIFVKPLEPSEIEIVRTWTVLSLSKT